MDDNKALEMRLEDEPFLNSKPNFSQNLIGLHNREIYTVNDFINMDLKSIPHKPRREEFFRMIDILKCKYLGEDLVCDVILFRKYPTTYQEYLKNKDQYHFPRLEKELNGFIEISKLNEGFSEKNIEEYFGDYMCRQIRYDIRSLGLLNLDTRPKIYAALLYERMYIKAQADGRKSISMLDFLDRMKERSKTKYLVDFYLEYIKMKETKKDDIIVSSELEELQKQLASLTSQRDDLDKQIEDIKVQIQLMSEGKNNARK